MRRAINWFGLGAGITTMLLIVVSLFVPWWVVQVGDGLFQINTSPLNTNFSLAGSPSFAVPIIWALNLASILTLAVGGILIFVYSLFPAKPYGRKLLDFSYKKPLYAVVFFVASLLALIIVMRSAFGVDVPLVGAQTIQLPKSMTLGTTITALVTADFEWPFWLAIAAAGLCVATRLFHQRAVNGKQSNLYFPSTPPLPPQPN
ncbi:MAG TPA: hypothetical protein VMD05_05025 [Candidatus Nanoarchaeia archaeon]|nr:hypothetical protein [Candidatus Nanoarchaeia archaeon]